MKFSTVLAALAVLAVSASAANIPENLEKRQWGGFGGFGGGFGGGMGGGKSINDYKREQVAGRDIHVWVPANLPPKSPLLLSLHGMDQDPNYQQQNTHWETLADTEGFVVVYPRGGTGMSTWDISGTKDTNWVLQIIDQMAKEYDIDTNRVYLSGFSMGGMFTYNAMSKIADKIAAFAPCSGPNVMGASRAQRPVPIIHVHGTNDDVLPYAQIEGYLKNYRDQFHCPAQAKTETNYPNSENPNATMYTWGPCDNDVYIKHLKLQGRGHSPSAADIGDIWKFVSQYSLGGKAATGGNTTGNTTGGNTTGNTTGGNTTGNTTGGNTTGNTTGGNTTTTKTLPNTNTNANCWSTSLGYPCCTARSIVGYTDASGQWGIQNNNWCGKPNTNNRNCWAKALGYNCCSTSTCRTVQFSDVDGQWDVENGQWCGIATTNTIC